jgi:hypothetical protein
MHPFKLQRNKMFISSKYFQKALDLAMERTESAEEVQHNFDKLNDLVNSLD